MLSTVKSAVSNISLFNENDKMAQINFGVHGSRKRRFDNISCFSIKLYIVAFIRIASFRRFD